MAAEGLRREFKVTVPAGEIEGRVASRLERMAKTVRLPGLPAGQGAAASAARSSMAARSWARCSKRRSTRAPRRPSATTSCARRCGRRSRSPRSTRARISSSSMKVEVLPEVPQVELGGISLTRLVAETPPDKVEEAIENFAKSRQKFEPPAEPRPAQDGDQLTIDFEGRIDGVAVRGRQRQGFPAAAGLAEPHDPGLRGAAHRRRCRRDARGRGDLPGRLCPKPKSPARTPCSRSPSRRSRRRCPMTLDDDWAKAAGLRGPGRAEGDLREAVHRRVPEPQPRPAEARAARPPGRRTTFPGAGGHGRPRVRRDLEAAPGRDRARRHGLEEPGKSEDELKAEYRAIAERRVRLGLILSDIGTQERDQGRGARSCSRR